MTEGDVFAEFLEAWAATVCATMPDLLRRLEDDEAERVVLDVESACGDFAGVKLSAWWPSKRRCPMPAERRWFRNGDGWTHLGYVAPEDGNDVWLIAEPAVPGGTWQSGYPRLLVFATTTAMVQQLLGRTQSYEYIVCSRRLDWFFAEDRERGVSVGGLKAIARLEASRR